MFPVLRTSFPFSPLASSTSNRLDSLFDHFFGDEGNGFRPSGGLSSVPVSIWQDDNHLHVEAELPGVSENDVEITVHNGVLTIGADRPQQEGRPYLYNGRTFGRFERAVVLPEAVDTDHVEATLKSGVLHIALPKHPEARPKKITLKTS
jgi:HSP20 family protein